MGGAQLCKTELGYVINLRRAYTSKKKKKRLLTLSMTVCAYVFPRAFSNIGCKRTNSAPCTKPHTQRLTPSAPRWSVSVYNAEVSQLSLVKLQELAQALLKELSGHTSSCSYATVVRRCCLCRNATRARASWWQVTNMRSGYFHIFAAKLIIIHK